MCRRVPSPPSQAREDVLITCAVRTTRARIIRLKNDYKELMSHIEKGLHEHHARLQEQQSQANATPSGQGAQAAASGSTAPPALEPPFAKVNSVVAGSPAEAAGLQVGDNITKFGWVDWTNHDKLARLTQVVSQNEGVSNTAVDETKAAWTPLTGHSFPSSSRRCGPALQARRRR